MKTHWRRKDRFALAVSIIVIAVSFSAFGLTLSRYPIYFDDEPFFNLSALRLLTAKTFAYTVHTDAPHSGEVWAYHGPFFPRMQIVTLKLFGANHFSCRIPSWFASHVAIGVLVFLLVRYGVPWGACALAVAWAGDSSAQEMLLGRPDGVSLLAVTLGFAALVTALRTAAPKWSFLCGLSLGAAIGFNVATLYFIPAAAVCLLCLRRMQMILKHGVALGFGLAIMAILFLACWLPKPVACWQQFQWFVALHGKDASRVLQEWIELPTTLNRARWWVMGLIGVWLCVLVPAALRCCACRRKDEAGLGGTQALVIVSTAFAASALLLFTLSSMYRYYLAYFTPWPIVGLAALASQAWRCESRMKIVLAILSAILAAAWLPSLAWNATKFREMALFYGKLDDTPATAMLSDAVPDGSTVYADPKYFILLHRAGLNFEPLPWYHTVTDFELPETSLLMLSRGYHSIIRRDRPEWLNERDQLAFTTVFPKVVNGAKWLREPFYLYGPGRRTKADP